MKKKQIETLLYSVVGVGAMFLILVVLNFITGTFKQRVDLTAEKLYTLSPGTKEILKKLQGKVELRYYFTQGEKEVDPGLKSFAQRVEDLLAEYKLQSGGKIVVKKYNPTPDSNDEDSANLDGIEGQPMMTGDRFYFGIAVSQEPVKVALATLQPQREKLLEYDLSRAISQVANPDKPVVGVMTPLPMFGQQVPPMMRMRGQQGSEPWVFITEIQRDFTVRQIPLDVDKIDDDVKVLLVAHPKDISDKAQYAIDQFVLRGGKLLAFLDGLALADKSNNQNPMMQLPGGGSSLDKLLKAWGVSFDSSKVVADINLPTQLMRPNSRQPDSVPAFLSLKKDQLNKDDVLTSQLDSIMLPFAGAFTGTPDKDLKETVLLKTTPDSQLIEGMMAMFSSDQIKKDFKASGTPQKLAIRLAGKFKTAFPDGKPAEKDAEKKDGEKKDAKPDNSLKESKSEGVVILVGDSDFIDDQWCVRVTPFFGQKIVQFPNGNMALAQAMVEQLAGDSSLITVRSRATVNRPFTVVQAKQAAAEQRFQEEIKKLEADLADTRKRLSELQTKKEPGQRTILSKEQQEEIARFKQKETGANKKLKAVKKDLAREIVSLENWVKGINIAGMPVIVILFGVGLAVVRSKRTKAK